MASSHNLELFIASGSPELPEGLSPEAFEDLLLRWGGKDERIQNYLKTLSPEEQKQAITFMQEMDQKARNRAEASA